MATTFIDKARITVRAGNGGNGAVAFHREKYVAAGAAGAICTSPRSEERLVGDECRSRRSP